MRYAAHETAKRRAHAHLAEVLRRLRLDELLEREFIRDGHTVRCRAHPKHGFGLEESSDDSGESKGARAVANSRAWLPQFNASATDGGTEPAFAQQPTDRHGGEQCQQCTTDAKRIIRHYSVDDYSLQTVINCFAGFVAALLVQKTDAFCRTAAA